jgi:YndJ-like protein
MTTTTAQRAELASRSRLPSPLLVGMVVWAAAMVMLPAPLAARILLLAPLVIVPRLIPLLPPRRWVGALGGWPSLVAALPLLVAFALPTGPLAAAFVVPWLVVALVGTAAAITHGLSQLPAILHPRHLPALGTDVALGFWGVAAIFLIVERLGVETGFSPVIVLLTATHFHFAGFGLLGLASLLAVSQRWLGASVLGLVVGIPITAIGFILVSDLISAIGALIVGSSGIGVAIALLTGRTPGASGWLSKGAGIALLVGMPMGIAWSFAILTGQSFLDLDTMIRTHGVLNSVAVLVAVAAYRSPGT